MADPHEIIWAAAGTDDQWTRFIALTQRVVGMAPSEAEAERVIFVQRALVNIYGTTFSQAVF
jgi:hypothetical protein